MDVKQINRLIDKLVEKGITEFELEREGFKIRICKDSPPTIVAATQVPAPAPQPLPVELAQVPTQQPVAEPVAEAPAEPPPAPTNNYHVVASPMVGTFYRAPSPGARPYVEVGDRVKKGQICCIVEAMKLMNEIAIEVNGTVVEVHPENAQPVEFGEPLISIEPTH